MRYFSKSFLAVQHLVLAIATTARLFAKKSVLQITLLILWKKAVVQHVERF